MASHNDTDIRLFFDHKVLKCVHLQGRDITVEIESVEAGKITGEGGKSDKMPIVKFRGKELPFGLNKTNAATLIAMYGPKPSGMIGKKITLYPTTCRGKEGKTVDCIRIRPMIPGGSATATTVEPVREPGDDSDVEPFAPEPRRS
jgi:hypothetical protein